MVCDRLSEALDQIARIDGRLTTIQGWARELWVQGETEEERFLAFQIVQEIDDLRSVYSGRRR